MYRAVQVAAFSSTQTNELDDENKLHAKVTSGEKKITNHLGRRKRVF